MSKLKGIPITLIRRHKAGDDPFGAPIYSEDEIVVKNVLIAPAGADDIATQLNLTGKKIAYTLAIPKDDTNIWEGQEVRFWGERWRVVGIPTQGIEELMPLCWNKKVVVERYE